MTGLLGGLAAALAVPALFEGLGFAGAARVMSLAARALAPARAAGRDGHAPPRGERRRLAATAAGSLCATGWLVGGHGGAAVCGLAGPPLALGVVAARRRRWRAAVADGAPAAARAIADALDAGSALPRALGLAVSDGAVAAPSRRLLAEAARAVELGARTDEALLAAARRAGPGAWQALVAATVLQREVGGDLARLLRELAGDLDATAESRSEARAASSQARLTARIVVGLPLAGVALVELGAPGSLSAIASDPLPRLMVAAACVLEAVALLAVRRIARVGDR